MVGSRRLFMFGSLGWGVLLGGFDALVYHRGPEAAATAIAVAVAVSVAVSGWVLLSLLLCLGGCVQEKRTRKQE